MVKIVNPLTNRLIQVGGKTYNELVSGNYLDYYFEPKVSPRNNGAHSNVYKVHGEYRRTMNRMSVVENQCRSKKLDEFEDNYEYAEDNLNYLWDQYMISTREYTERDIENWNAMTLQKLDEAWST
jgi:hypothetical protein